MAFLLAAPPEFTPPALGPVGCPVCGRALGAIVQAAEDRFPTYRGRYKGRQITVPLFVAAGCPVPIVIGCEGQPGVGCEGEWRWPDPSRASASEATAP